MLVSHSHKFIFIKTKKTAGSSLQEYLTPYCKNGIVEKYIPGGHRSAESTKKKVGDEIWNNYLKICPVRDPWDLIASYYYWRRRERSVFVKLKRILKGKKAKDYSSKLTFNEFIIWMSDTRDLNINSGVMEVDGEWPDYFFIRYENLYEDLSALCQKLNIPYKADRLPKLRTGKSKEKDYRSLYDDETREIVAQAFSKDIARFGYQF